MSADIQVMPSIYSKQDAPPNFASSLTPRSRAFLKVISVLGSRTSTMVKPRTVTNDAGWTTIKNSGGRRGGRSQRRDETQLHLSDVDRDVDQDQLQTEYATITNTLKDTRFFQESIAEAGAKVFPSVGEATGVVALGLGSLVSLSGWRTTMFQIAYLEQLLAASGLSALPKYVQDPVLKDADVAFFKQLGYTILQDPVGFDTICENTFVYAPHLENTHTANSFDREPLAMICNDVSMWTSIMPEVELAKYPALKTVEAKYSAYELPLSEDIAGGRVFNNLVFYYPLKETKASSSAGIRLKITPAEPGPRISPVQEKKGFSLQQGERNFLKPEKWVARPSFTLNIPSPKAFRLRALNAAETLKGMEKAGGEQSLFMRRRTPERVDRPSFVPPPVVRSNGTKLFLRKWEPSTGDSSPPADSISVPASPTTPRRFERNLAGDTQDFGGFLSKFSVQKHSPNFIWSSMPTPLPDFDVPNTPRDLPLVPPVVPKASTSIFPNLPPPSPVDSKFPCSSSSLLSCPDSNEAINGLRQLLPAPKPKSKPLLSAIKTDIEPPIPSPRLGRLELRKNVTSSKSPNGGGGVGDSLLARRAAKRSSSVPLTLTTKRNSFDIEPPPSPMTATFGTKDILDDSLPPPPPSPRPAAKALKLVLPPREPIKSNPVPIPGPLVDPLFPGNHSASRAADNLRNFSRGSKGWRSGLASRRQSA